MEKSGKSKFSELKLQSVRKGLSGETLRFSQEMNGVPVLNGDIAVHFNKQGFITYMAETVYTKNLQKINTTPTISAQAALEKAKIVSEPKGNIEFEENKLFVYNLNDGDTKLVYRVTINSYEKKGSWETIIDAHTGEVISMKDVSIYHNGHDEPLPKKKETPKKIMGSENKTLKTSGTAYVFDPDPLSPTQQTYGGTYVDNNDATNASLDAARTLVNLPDVTLLGSTYSLNNSYVMIADFEAPSTGLFSQSTPHFLFNRNEQGFEAVNVFYHIDKNLRYINETLGIQCKPTLNSGVVRYDPHGVSGTDNSHYVLGTQSLAFGKGGVDDAEDADVIIHELGHGVHHWLTGLSSSSAQG